MATRSSSGCVALNNMRFIYMVSRALTRVRLKLRAVRHVRGCALGHHPVKSVRYRVAGQKNVWAMRHGLQQGGENSWRMCGSSAAPAPAQPARCCNSSAPLRKIHRCFERVNQLLSLLVPVSDINRAAVGGGGAWRLSRLSESILREFSAGMYPKLTQPKTRER